MKHRVILDCDPGHDDVVAILLAANETDLRAITTVSGNAPLDRTTQNALVALTVFGLDIPVYAGADRPLFVEPYHFPQIHGASGLAGPSLPTPAAIPQNITAVERLLDEARLQEGVWIIATGPLTNVAMAIRADPQFARRIAGISIMGGGLTFGNVTPAAEYNLWADPEAAAIVMSSGASLILCPLDVTHRVLIERDFIAEVRSIGTTVAIFMGDLFDHFIEAYADVFFGRAEAPLHDPLAVLALTHPHLFKFEDLHVEIGRDGPARGMTIADRRGVKGGALPNVRVAVEVTSAGVLDLVLKVLATPEAPWAQKSSTNVPASNPGTDPPATTSIRPS